MSTIRLKRAPGDGAIVAHAESCVSCRGCGRIATQFDLPRDVDEVDLFISASDQNRILWNSLGKPIGCLLFAALLADVFGLSEPESVLAAVAGFVVGCFNCVALPETILEKRSVS